MPRLFFALSIASFFLALSPDSQARSTGACFTKDETRQMILLRETFSKEAAACLNSYWSSHARFHNQNKYSKYYGNLNKGLNTQDKRAMIILNVLWPKLLTQAEQQAFLTDFYKDKVKDKDGDLPAPGLPDLEKWMEKGTPNTYASYLSHKAGLKLDERASEEKGQKGEAGSDLKPNSGGKLQNISCVDMTRRCLRQGFEKAGMLGTFKKIDAEVVKHAVSGVVLQKVLIDLGWKSFYWNANTSQNAAYDAEDRRLNPPTAAKPWQSVWGAHAYRWNRNCTPEGRKIDPGKSGGVLCSGEYHIGSEPPVLIDDKELLVNFGKSPPESFLDVPFFVGSAHAGYHIFAGFDGRVLEAHSARGLRAQDNLEISRFDPLEQEDKGGPRWTETEKYRSGVIVVPPGYLENGPLTLHEPQMDGECVDLHPSKP